MIMSVVLSVGIDCNVSRATQSIFDSSPIQAPNAERSLNTQAPVPGAVATCGSTQCDGELFESTAQPDAFT